MFSNGFYLDLKKENKEEEREKKYENNEDTIGFIYMVKWNFEKSDKYYYFINTEKENRNILTVENGKVKVNKEKVEENEMFELIDVLEEE